MSKLSPSLKALINTPFSRPGPLPAPSHAKELFQSIAQDASKKNLSPRSWLAISVSRSVQCLPGVYLDYHQLVNTLT